MGVPVLASHSRTVSSPLALAMVFPSGLNDTLETQPVCPSSVRMRAPVLASHSRTVLSPQLPLALAIVSPSGLNDTL